MSAQLRVPLLAPSQTLTEQTIRDLTYPVYVSPKYDGIRCTIQGGRTVGRKSLYLPNQHIQERLRRFEGLDGEIVCGDPTMDGGFNYTQSVVMGNLKSEDWRFFVFDTLNDPGVFADRLQSIAQEYDEPKLVVVPQWLVTTPEQLLEHELDYRTRGYEGVMVRTLTGLYPVAYQGEIRSPDLRKFKRFEDSEGLIIDVFQGEINNNPAFKDERGRTKRSTSKAGMVPSGYCGGFLVRDPRFGWDCVVGPGRLKKAQLKDIWDNRDQYVGKRVLKYSFQLKGEMTLPRFPTAQGFRDQGE